MTSILQLFIKTLSCAVFLLSLLFYPFAIHAKKTPNSEFAADNFQYNNLNTHPAIFYFLANAGYCSDKFLYTYSTTLNLAGLTDSTPCIYGKNFRLSWIKNQDPALAHIRIDYDVLLGYSTKPIRLALVVPSTFETLENGRLLSLTAATEADSIHHSVKLNLIIDTLDQSFILMNNKSALAHGVFKLTL